MSAATRVWRVRCAVDDFQILLFDGPDEEASVWRDAFDGLSECHPIADSWVPPPVYVPFLNHEHGDVLSFDGDLVLTKRAVDWLQPLLWCAELLPVTLDREPLWIVHALEEVNCLDAARSELRPSGSIRRPEFIEHRLPEAPLFKIPQDVAIYTPELAAAVPRFRERVDAGMLRGFAFSEAWNSVEGGKRQAMAWERHAP